MCLIVVWEGSDALCDWRDSLNVIFHSIRFFLVFSSRTIFTTTNLLVRFLFGCKFLLLAAGWIFFASEAFLPMELSLPALNGISPGDVVALVLVGGYAVYLSRLFNESSWCLAGSGGGMGMHACVAERGRSTTSLCALPWVFFAEWR